MNKRNYYLLCLIVFLQGFVFYGPFAFVYRQSRGLFASDIFIIETIFLAVSMLMEIPFGYISDKFGYKKTLIISNFLFFISKIVFYKSYSLYGFLIERILLAISFAGLSGCDTSMLYKSVSKDNSYKAFSKYNLSSQIGVFLGFLLSGFIVKISLDSTALFTIYPYFIAFLLTLFLNDVDYEKENLSFLITFKEAFVSKKFILLILAIGIFKELIMYLTVFLSQIKYTNIGIDLKYFGLLTLSLQFFRILAAKISGHIKKNQYKIIISIMIFSIISIILLASNTNIYIVIGLIMILGFNHSFVIPIFIDIQNKNIKTDNRATILSINSMMISLALLPINPLIGFITDTSLNYALLFIAFVFIICLSIVIYYSKKINKKDQNKANKTK